MYAGEIRKIQKSQEDTVKSFQMHSVLIDRKGKGRPTEVPIIQLWLEHESSRCKHRVVFDPTHAGHSDFNFNLFDGFSIQLQGQGSIQTSDLEACRLWFDHLFYVTANCSQARFEVILRWMAKVYRQPVQRGGIALVFTGKPGSGKSLVFKLMSAIIGKKYSLAYNGMRELLDKFSHSKAMTAILTLVDEVKDCTSGEMNKLKTLISEESINVQEKYCPTITLQNMQHFIFHSNHAHPIPLEAGDRRFAFFPVSGSHSNPGTVEHCEYFNSLYQLDPEKLLSLARILCDVELKDNYVSLIPPECRDQSPNDEVLTWLDDKEQLKILCESNQKPEDVQALFSHWLKKGGSSTINVPSSSFKSMLELIFKDDLKLIRPRSEDLSRPRVYQFPPFEKASAIIATLWSSTKANGPDFDKILETKGLAYFPVLVRGSPSNHGKKKKGIRARANDHTTSKHAHPHTHAHPHSHTHKSTHVRSLHDTGSHTHMHVHMHAP